VNLRLISQKERKKKEICSFPQSSGCSTFALCKVMTDSSENIGENLSHCYDPKTFLRHLFPMSPQYSERTREKKRVPLLYCIQTWLAQSLIRAGR
jgi:hypothetical protein